SNSIDPKKSAQLSSSAHDSKRASISDSHEESSTDEDSHSVEEAPSSPRTPVAISSPRPSTSAIKTKSNLDNSETPQKKSASEVLVLPLIASKVPLRVKQGLRMPPPERLNRVQLKEIFVPVEIENTTEKP